MSRTASLDDATAAICSAAATPGKATRIVAIDGLGGAGKSTLARVLAERVGAAIVHTDDFAGWEDPLGFGPVVVEQVLEPLGAGRVARFVPASWGGPARPEVSVAPGGLVLIEGVSASRAAFRPYLALALWVETRPDLRLRRGLERDGEGARSDWERWMAAEDDYAAFERPAEHADLVLAGDRDLWA